MYKKYYVELFNYYLHVHISDEWKTSDVTKKLVVKDIDYIEAISNRLRDLNEGFGGYHMCSDIGESIILVSLEEYNSAPSLIGCIAHELTHFASHLAERADLCEETKAYLVEYYIKKIIKDFKILDMF